MFTNFRSIIDTVKAHPVKRRVAVAAAEDLPVLEAVVSAHKEHVADSVLI